MREAENSACPVLPSVVPDGFDRAAFHRLDALGLLFGGVGLLVNVGIPAIVAAGEIGRGGLAAEVAVDALVINVEFTGDVFGVFVFEFGHNVICFVPAR